MQNFVNIAGCLGTVFRAKRLRTGRTESARVLMLTQYLGMGGLERMILNLSIELKSGGRWSPFVFVFDHGEDSPSDSNLVNEFRRRGVQVETFAKPAGFSARVAIAIARYCERNDIEVIHSHDMGALIYGVIAKWLTLNRVRLVHTQHSFVHLERKRRYRLYEKFFTRFCDELSTVSDATKETYVELGLDPARIEVVSNGATFAEAPTVERGAKLALRDELIRAARLPAGTPEAFAGGPERAAQLRDQVWMLYMARIHGGKGQDHALRLWSALSAPTRSRLVLVFIGAETEKGRLAALARQAAAAPDRDRILFLGVTHAPGKWLAASDLALSCSEYEGMPLGPIEAVGSGLPTLLSDIPGHRLLQGLSRQYPLGDVARGARELEEWVAVLPGSEPLWRDLWKHSQTIRDRFSLGAMAGRYSTLYRRAESAAE